MRYINIDSRQNMLPAKGKAAVLVKDGGQVIEGDTFVPNMICVIDNPLFEAAAYLEDEEQYARALAIIDRPTIFLQHPYAKRMCDV